MFQNFYDPAHDQERAAIDRLKAIAWDAYQEGRKAPRTAMPLCHWPCSCYPNHATGQVGDRMAEIYGRWVSAHGVLLLTQGNLERTGPRAARAGAEAGIKGQIGLDHFWDRGSLLAPPA